MPPFTKMLVTSNTYTEEECVSESGLIEKDSVGMLKDIQEVIAVGPGVREYKPGDLVQIDFSKYARKRYTKDDTKADLPDEYYNATLDFEIPMFEVDNKVALLVDSANIFFRIDEFEWEVTEVTPPKVKKLVC